MANERDVRFGVAFALAFVCGGLICGVLLSFGWNHTAVILAFIAGRIMR